MKVVKYLLILFAAVLVFSCEEQVIAVTGVEITADKDTIEVGETLELSVKVLPENATNTKYIINANPADVLTIEGNMVTGAKAGKVTLTAITDENAKSAIFKLVVKKAENSGNEGGGNEGGGNEGGGNEGGGNEGGGNEGGGNEGGGNEDGGNEDGGNEDGGNEDGGNEDSGNEDDEEQTPDTSTKFSFDIKVDGVDVVVKVTPTSDSMYFYGCVTREAVSNPIAPFKITKTDLEYYIEGLMQEVKTANPGMSDEEALTSLCHTGEYVKTYSHTDEDLLMRNEGYVVFACIVTLDGEEPVVGNNISKGNFTTGISGTYENQITITASDITASSMTVSFETTKPEEKYYIYYASEDEFAAYAEVIGYSSMELIWSIWNDAEAGNLTLIEKTGDSSISLTGLTSGTEYHVLAFGWNGDRSYYKMEPRFDAIFKTK